MLINNAETYALLIAISYQCKQMSRMLDILQDYLGWRGHSYERLDGSVRGEERYAAINNFADNDTFCFLLSTRAVCQHGRWFIFVVARNYTRVSLRAFVGARSRKLYVELTIACVHVCQIALLEFQY
jgi:hypothetical protein